MQLSRIIQEQNTIKKFISFNMHFKKLKKVNDLIIYTTITF